MATQILEQPIPEPPELPKVTTKDKLKRLVFGSVFVLGIILVFSIPGVLIGSSFANSFNWIGWISWVSGLFIGIVFAGVVVWAIWKNELEWKELYNKMAGSWNDLMRLYNTHKERADRLKDILDQHFGSKVDQIREVVRNFYDDMPGITKVIVDIDEEKAELVVQIGNGDEMIDVDTTFPIDDLVERLERARIEWIGRD
jgi:hypothetical protein